MNEKDLREAQQLLKDAKTHPQFSMDLAVVMRDLQVMLIEKNTKYGDAALNPNQTFSKVDPIELINVRIDDKLSRIRNRQNNEDEDPELDLIGYLILKRIALMRRKEADLIKKSVPISVLDQKSKPLDTTYGPIPRHPV